jgi:gluconolactonase
VAKATIRRTAVPQPLPDPSGAATETPSPHLNRRTLLTAALGAAAVAAAPVGAQPPAQSVSPNATPRDWSGREPVRYPDPDLVALDARFQKYILFNTAIVRLYTGSLWAEGPAWNAVGRYVVWSDIPNNRQLRFIEDDARVTTFRQPSGNSNGNTFDFEGRQLSCEHGGRRVARYEHDGRVTALAERYNGKRLNSPNDIAAHPDGSVWFTDPTYGIRGDYEGERAESEMKPAVYRVDASGRVALATDEVDQPNGICFSPDYKKVYVADTGMQETKVWDLAGTQLRSGKTFVKLDIPGTGQASAADGIRCDVDGNLWCGARPGVQIVAPNGERIGMIRLPEVCANICFGGARRNRLFMAASQSLYAVYVGVRGAGVA